MSIERALTSLSAAALVAFASSFPLPAMAHGSANALTFNGEKPQAMGLQGSNPQGMNMQGVNMQGVSTNALTDNLRGFEIIGIELPD